MRFKYPYTDTTQPDVAAFIAAESAKSEAPEHFKRGAENWLEDHPEPDFLRFERLAGRSHINTPAREHTVANNSAFGPAAHEREAWIAGYRWAQSLTDELP